MNIGYDDTKNRQGGAYSPLLKKRSWAGRTWRKLVGGVGKGARAVGGAAKKAASDISQAYKGQN